MGKLLDFQLSKMLGTQENRSRASGWVYNWARKPKSTQIRLKTEWQKVKREARGDAFDEPAMLQDLATRTARPTGTTRS